MSQYVAVCSCGKETKPGWTRCVACEAAYHRNYRNTVVLRAIRRARKEGAEALRERAIQVFMEVGAGELNGLTAVEILRDLVVA